MEFDQTADEVFVTAVVFEIALGALAILLGWLLGPDARAAIPELTESAWPAVKGVLIGCLAAIPLLILMEGVRRIPCEPVRALEKLSDGGMFKALLSLSPIELILISICAGVGEELLFRGWLMSWLIGIGGEAPLNYRIAGALIGSSIAFGLVHYLTKLYLLLATLMGLYFGVLLLWSGNLLVPIAAHAAYDAVLLVMAKNRPEEPTNALANDLPTDLASEVEPIVPSDGSPPSDAECRDAPHLHGEQT